VTEETIAEASRRQRRMLACRRPAPRVREVQARHGGLFARRAIESRSPGPEETQGGSRGDHLVARAFDQDQCKRQRTRERRGAAVALVDLLRDRLGLTGTHVGCDTTNCGACTVLLDGKSVKSCTMFAVQADGREIVTIEGCRAPTGSFTQSKRRSGRTMASNAAFALPGW